MLTKCVNNGGCLFRRWHRIYNKRPIENIVDSSNDGFSDEERDYQIEINRIKIEFQPLHDLPDFYMADGKPCEITNNQLGRHQKRLRTGFAIKEAFVQVENAHRVEPQAYATKATMRRQQKSYAISKNVSNYITDLRQK